VEHMEGRQERRDRAEHDFKSHLLGAGGSPVLRHDNPHREQVYSTVGGEYLQKLQGALNVDDEPPWRPPSIAHPRRLPEGLDGPSPGGILPHRAVQTIPAAYPPVDCPLPHTHASHLSLVAAHGFSGPLRLKAGRLSPDGSPLISPNEARTRLKPITVARKRLSSGPVSAPLLRATQFCQQHANRGDAREVTLAMARRELQLPKQTVAQRSNAVARKLKPLPDKVKYIAAPHGFVLQRTHPNTDAAWCPTCNDWFPWHYMAAHRQVCCSVPMTRQLEVQARDLKIQEVYFKEDQAARKIQRVLRGYQGREYANVLRRWYTKAVLRLQRFWRRYKTRARLKHFCHQCSIFVRVVTRAGFMEPRTTMFSLWIAMYWLMRPGPKVNRWGVFKRPLPPPRMPAWQYHWLRLCDGAALHLIHEASLGNLLKKSAIVSTQMHVEDFGSDPAGAAQSIIADIESVQGELRAAQNSPAVLPTPSTLRVELTRNHPKNYFSGLYGLLGTSDEEKPVWQHQGGKSWLYRTHYDHWMFTTVREDIQHNMGQVRSTNEAEGFFPHMMSGWMHCWRMDKPREAWQWQEDDTIDVLKSDETFEPEMRPSTPVERYAAWRGDGGEGAPPWFQAASHEIGHAEEAAFWSTMLKGIARLCQKQQAALESASEEVLEEEDDGFSEQAREHKRKMAAKCKADAAEEEREVKAEERRKEAEWEALGYTDWQKWRLKGGTGNPPWFVEASPKIGYKEEEAFWNKMSAKVHAEKVRAWTDQWGPSEPPWFREASPTVGYEEEKGVWSTFSEQTVPATEQGMNQERQVPTEVTETDDWEDALFSVLTESTVSAVGTEQALHEEQGAHSKQRPNEAHQTCGEPQESSINEQQESSIDQRQESSINEQQESSINEQQANAIKEEQQESGIQQQLWEALQAEGKLREAYRAWCDAGGAGVPPWFRPASPEIGYVEENVFWKTISENSVGSGRAPEETNKSETVKRYGEWRQAGGVGAPPWFSEASAEIGYEEESIFWESMQTSSELKMRYRKWRDTGGTGPPPWFRPASPEIGFAHEASFWTNMGNGIATHATVT